MRDWSLEYLVSLYLIQVYLREQHCKTLRSIEMYVLCFAILPALSCKNEKVFVLIFHSLPLPLPIPHFRPSLSGLIHDFRVYSSYTLDTSGTSQVLYLGVM